MSEVLSYAALKESHDRLLAENVAMKGALTAGKYLDFIKHNNWNPAVKTVNGKFSCFMDPEVDFGSMVYSFAKGLIDTAATPATSAALAAIEARGVEKFADVLGAMCQQEKVNSVRARVLKHVVFLAVHHAKELRRAK
ncbi:Uncharacterised protein [Serratia plymuthica]|uniref:hypothetical protein n=1 Tax=Serratia plymuthica TaxID=82996 RepID=UPI002179FEA3|nr:hypothetical protein [Serratia plymuthica]CAI0731478.1 Uncharacterised protein [Serratia plymuthica]